MRSGLKGAVVVCGGFLAGCNPLGLGDREFTIRVDSLSVPASVAADESIPVRVFGFVGKNTCFRFTHFEVTRNTARVRLTARGKEAVGGACGQAIQDLDEVYLARPPFGDPFLVEIRQPGGTLLGKTVRIE